MNSGCIALIANEDAGFLRSGRTIIPEWLVFAIAVYQRTAATFLSSEKANRTGKESADIHIQTQKPQKQP